MCLQESKTTKRGKDPPVHFERLVLCFKGPHLSNVKLLNDYCIALTDNCTANPMKKIEPSNFLKPLLVDVVTKKYEGITTGCKRFNVGVRKTSIEVRIFFFFVVFM